MHKVVLRLTAVLSLSMSALSAYSAGIPISYLPFNITASGNYEVTANLSYPVSTGTAITITPNLKGPVVLNLQGYALTGISKPGTSENYSVGVGVFGSGPGASSITIETER
jgi:hypothetical protein